MDVNELRRQHRELTVIAQQLLQAVEDSNARQSVGAIRWKLARHLMSHLALEDRIFYPAMQRLADERARTAAMKLQSEMGTLAKDFSAYMHRWSDDHVARQWTAFCADTREIIGKLKARIDQEERQLYPLAEALGRDALPFSKAG